MSKTAFAIIVLLLPRLLAAATEPDPQFFRQYCIKCHGSEKQQGEIRLDRIDEPFFSNTVRLTALVSVLDAGEMPPPEQEQPPAEIRTQIVKTLKGKLLKQAVPSLIKRLTREEYANRINDLFDTDFDLTDLLPEDRNKDGFNKLGESHRMSPYQVQSYLNAARFVADRVVLDGKPQQQQWVFGPENFAEQTGGTTRQRRRESCPPSTRGAAIFTFPHLTITTTCFGSRNSGVIVSKHK
ncbi:MAG: DUF1587 domain-containing protein [Fuerstiella sp.]|nr:DUF1587 domain-containing protein [Fuerstiella sp.]